MINIYLNKYIFKYIIFNQIYFREIIINFKNKNFSLI